MYTMAPTVTIRLLWEDVVILTRFLEDEGISKCSTFHSLCARQCCKHSTWLIILMTNLHGKCQDHPHFTDEEAEAQRGQVTYTKSERVPGEAGCKPWKSCPAVHTLKSCVPIQICQSLHSQGPSGYRDETLPGCQVDSPCKLETPMSGAHVNLDFPTVLGSSSLERTQQIGKARSVSCPTC